MLLYCVVEHHRDEAHLVSGFADLHAAKDWAARESHKTGQHYELRTIQLSDEQVKELVE